MAGSPETERGVQLSVIDRLIDRDPTLREEAPLTRAQSLRIHREAVRRDLEWLLNSHRSIIPVPEAYRELERSLFAYGLPDINSIRLESQADQQRLVRAIQLAIELFEPRLTRVRVNPLTPIRKSVLTIRFQIEAQLRADPVPEQISFDTVLEVARGSYEVKS